MNQATRFALLFTVSLSLSANAAKWDHVHILVPDTKAAAEWYAEHFDGKITKSGPFDAVLFGDDLVKFRVSTPDTKGTLNSSIYHIAFSVKDVPAKRIALEKTGIKVSKRVFEMGTNGTLYALVEDPWGTRIRIISDDSVSGFHHVHLESPDPESAIAWYADHFGGKVTSFLGMASLHAIRYGDMWLLINKSDAPEPSTGHSIDHLGWNMPDFDELVTVLKKEGTEFALEPRPADKPTMAYILGPDGAKIEIVRAGAH
jgi:catechol 2,3-dioxygenase-like lactoylglutathione lyase family enzyme